MKFIYVLFSLWFASATFLSPARAQEHSAPPAAASTGSQSPTTASTTASGATTGAASADWCAEHEVPESLCTRCNEELIPAFKASGDWCEEHGLPESQCRLCNPELGHERPAGGK